MLYGRDRARRGTGDPLQPPDRSSPRATLQTFLDSADVLGAFLAYEYLPDPTRAKFQRLVALGETPVQCLDLSETPPAGRIKTGRVAAVNLYEILSRLRLSAIEDIPDAEQMNQRSGAGANRWVIPHTEIALVRLSVADPVFRPRWWSGRPPY